MVAGPPAMVGVCQTAEVLLYNINSAERPCDDLNDRFSVGITGPGGYEVEALVEVTAANCRSITFTTTKAGKYRIRATVHGAVLGKGPIVLEIASQEVDVSRCTIGNATVVSTPGSAVHMTLKACDSYDNLCSLPVDRLRFEFSLIGDDGVAAEVHPALDLQRAGAGRLKLYLQFGTPGLYRGTVLLRDGSGAWSALPSPLVVVVLTEDEQAEVERNTRRNASVWYEVKHLSEAGPAKAWIYFTGTQVWVKVPWLKLLSTRIFSMAVSAVSSFR